MAAGGCWNSRPDCIFSLTNHIAIAFPPLRPFRHTQRCVSPTFCQSWLIFKMETSKRRQIPMTNACPNFSFRGLAKNVVTLFRDGFRDYFRHAYKLHTSQRQPSTRTGEFTMSAAGRASGPTLAAPGINYDHRRLPLLSPAWTVVTGTRP